MNKRRQKAGGRRQKFTCLEKVLNLHQTPFALKGEVLDQRKKDEVYDLLPSALVAKRLLPSRAKPDNICLAIAFYMDHSLAVWNSLDESLIEVPIQRPMGMGFTDTGFYLGSKYGISWFERIYHQKEDKWLYRQSFTKYLGFIDCHELVISYGKPVFTNTLFGCLSSAASDRDFNVYFQPEFIKELVPEDHSHLNGIALEDGMPRYISCFAPNNEPGLKSWKDKPRTGCVWDLPRDRAVISDLALPHSPRVIDEDLFVCDSGRGRILRREGGKLEAIVQLNSFTRGMIATEDFIIVATSKVRDGANNVQLDRDRLSVNRCGLHFLDRQSFKLVECFYFEDKKEIFDIQLIPENHYIITADSEPFRFIHKL